MAGLGSVTEGMVGTQLDLQALQLGNQKIESNKIALQSEQVQLTKDKIQLAQQMRMLSLLQNAHIGQSGDQPSQNPIEMSSWLTELSQIQLQSGLVDDATKTANIASRLQENASKIDYRSFKMQNDRFSKFISVLDSVPDSPGGLQQAVAMMAAEDPGVARDPKFQAIAKMPWQPGLIAMLKSQALSAKDAAEVKYKEAATKHADAAAAVDIARVNLVKTQTRLADDRDKALKKDGVTLYKAEQLKAITDKVKVDYSEGSDEDIRNRSRPLAEEVASMMKKQNLTLSEAATRVYEQAKSRGDFAGLRMQTILPGSKPGKPLELPKKPTDVKQNKWYMVKGKPMIAIGTKFFTEEEMSASERDDEALLGDDKDEDNEDAD